MQGLSYEAYKRVGTVIRLRLARYSVAKDDYSKELYKVYYRIFKHWEELGYEKDCFKGKRSE